MIADYGYLKVLLENNNLAKTYRLLGDKEEFSSHYKIALQ